MVRVRRKDERKDRRDIVDLILPFDILYHDRYSESFVEFIMATWMCDGRKTGRSAMKKKIETEKGLKIGG